MLSYNCNNGDLNINAGLMPQMMKSTSPVSQLSLGLVSNQDGTPAAPPSTPTQSTHPTISLISFPYTSQHPQNLTLLNASPYSTRNIPNDELFAFKNHSSMNGMDKVQSLPSSPISPNTTACVSSSSSSSTSPSSPPLIILISEKQFQMQQQQKLACMNNGLSSSASSSSRPSSSSSIQTAISSCSSCGSGCSSGGGLMTFASPPVSPQSYLNATNLRITPTQVHMQPISEATLTGVLSSSPSSSTLFSTPVYRKETDRIIISDSMSPLSAPILSTSYQDSFPALYTCIKSPSSPSVQPVSQTFIFYFCFV